jgi:biotin operon repressor
MRYRKSLEIEQRLAEALRLIQTGQYSTPKLAESLGVSIPTISRYVTALRERGHDIRAAKHPEGWRYVTTSNAEPQKSTSAGKSKKLAGAGSERR